MESSFDLRRLLYDSLKTVHNHGASLFNKGRHVEAFRLYQGALFVALKVLDGRSELKLIVAEGLSDVERSSATEQLKAYRLHEVIEHLNTALRDPENASRQTGANEETKSKTH